MKTLLCALAILGGALSVAAQTVAEPEFKIACQGNWMGSRNAQQHCETRDLTMAAPTGQPLTIDGGANGGIAVHGWDGPNVRIRATVRVWGSSAAIAQARAKSIEISTANNALRATAPAQTTQWSVSYELFVPRQTALALNTVNGGIRLDNLQAAIRFHAVNGGVSLNGLGGHVTGDTVNGGLSIALAGTTWVGQGLDVQTTNGGINWKLAPGYSAQLFTSTDMGSVRAEGLNVIKSGFMHQEITASLGNGGAPVRAVTTNGGIRVAQGRE